MNKVRPEQLSAFLMYPQTLDKERLRIWSHHADLRRAFNPTKVVHRFLCFGGKMERHAGISPASAGLQAAAWILG